MFCGVLGRTLAACSFAAHAHAAPVHIDWQSIGGQDVFERQAVTFAPIPVSAFIGLETSGEFRNLVHTEGSGLLAQIFVRLGSDWVLLADDSTISGPPGTEFALDGFRFYDVDFSAGYLSGINFTNSLAGATQYFSMTSLSGGTVFSFEQRAVSEPPYTGLAALLAFGLAHARSRMRKVGA